MTRPRRWTTSGFGLLVILLGAPFVPACSGGDSANTSGAGGSGSGGATDGGVSDGSIGNSGAETGGGDSGGGDAGGGADTGGSEASDGAIADGAAASDGATGGDTAGDTGGGTNCAGNAVSLSANGSGMDSDTAQAEVVIDLMGDAPLGSAPRTVEFWAYIQSSDWIGEYNEIFYSGSRGPNMTFGMDFGTYPVDGMPDNHATLNPFTDGTLSVDNGTYLGIASATAQWVHIATSWDGTTRRTYVNGTERITSTATDMLATGAGPLILGCCPENMHCFNGLFDEARVWNVARSDADIMANYNRPLAGNEAGLIGYWKFDETPGSVSAADSVTSAGHTAHGGTLTAAMDAQRPTFVKPDSPAPIVCP
jgi:hypothetical protein